MSKSPVTKKTVGKKRTVNHYVDSETGEILKTSIENHSFNFYVSNDDFFMTYSSVLKVLVGTTPLEGMLLQKMCFACNFNEGVVHLSPSLRERWRKEMKCTKQSISNALLHLKQKQLIVPTEDGFNGSFLINPVYFFRGNQEGRNNAYNLMMQIMTKVDNNKTEL